MIPMNKPEFCESFVYLKKKPISFASRPYLRAPYNSSAQRLLIRASRQVEKTHLSGEHDPVHGGEPAGHMPPAWSKRVFSNSRLLPAILESPFIKRCLLFRSSSVVCWEKAAKNFKCGAVLQPSAHLRLLDPLLPDEIVHELMGVSRTGPM